MNEFDIWRERYNTMTVDEQKQYHNQLEQRFPEQNHYNYEAVKEALNLLPHGFKVLEFGTWKGDLARQVFDDFPCDEWHGVEICEAAVEKRKSRLVNYIIPNRFDWFYEQRTINADIVIATHFIEHLSNEHFTELCRYIYPIKYVHFEPPLTPKGNKWDGYLGTHKLEFGWDAVTEEMENNGYRLIIDHPESKTYICE